jgi:hypothetical protein
MDHPAIRGNQPELRNQFLRQRADVGPVKFATPTVFNGKVFAGARNEGNNGGTVDVWGLCSENPGGVCLE